MHTDEQGRDFGITTTGSRYFNEILTQTPGKDTRYYWENRNRAQQAAQDEARAGNMYVVKAVAGNKDIIEPIGLAVADVFTGGLEGLAATGLTSSMAIAYVAERRAAAAAATKTSRSLGAGRTGVKKWLQGAGDLERGELIQNIESVGFKLTRSLLLL